MWQFQGKFSLKNGPISYFPPSPECSQVYTHAFPHILSYATVSFPMTTDITVPSRKHLRLTKAIRDSPSNSMKLTSSHYLI